MASKGKGEGGGEGLSAVARDLGETEDVRGGDLGGFDVEGPEEGRSGVGAETAAVLGEEGRFWRFLAGPFAGLAIKV